MSRAALRYERFIDAARRFFASALIAACGVVVLAPLDSIRAFGMVAFACAACGFALQLIASRHHPEPKPRYARIPGTSSPLSVAVAEAGNP
jgi:hypothetical protein